MTARQTFAWLRIVGQHVVMMRDNRCQGLCLPLERFTAHGGLIALLNCGIVLGCSGSSWHILFILVLDRHHLGGYLSLLQEQLSTPLIGGRLFHQKPSSARGRAAVQSCSTGWTPSRGCHSEIRAWFLRSTHTILLFVLLTIVLCHEKFVVDQSLLPVLGSNISTNCFASIRLFLMLPQTTDSIGHQ